MLADSTITKTHPLHVAVVASWLFWLKSRYILSCDLACVVYYSIPTCRDSYNCAIVIIVQHLASVHMHTIFCILVIWSVGVGGACMCTSWSWSVKLDYFLSSRKGKRGLADAISIHSLQLIQYTSSHLQLTISLHKLEPTFRCWY